MSTSKQKGEGKEWRTVAIRDTYDEAAEIRQGYQERGYGAPGSRFDRQVKVSKHEDKGRGSLYYAVKVHPG